MNSDSLQAFVYAAELGSFSAAARRMGKAQSAISVTIANLEIDCGIDLFDRGGRSPTLTSQGKALLPHARGILLGHRELLATANSLAEGIETRVRLSVEQGISIVPLRDILREFSVKFGGVSLELSTPSPEESANLLRSGSTDIGLMAEQEGYPAGLQFRGVGYSRMIPVCAPDHPLAEIGQATYRDLRQHRQFIRYKHPKKGTTQQYEKKSSVYWQATDPDLIAYLVRCGFGWAELPNPVVAESITSGDLVSLSYAFQQNDLLEGIDLVWTEHHALGIAGQWLREEISKLPQAVWQQE